MYAEIFENFNNLNFDFKVQMNENPIINILNYFKICTYINMGNINNRVKFDGDAQYVYSNSTLKNDKARKQFAKRADTMVSFFTPYKYAISKKYKKTYYKTEEFIDELLRYASSGEYEEVNSHFSEFAELYQDSGNIILLPDPKNCDGRMNCLKYNCSEDRIDKAVFECFDSGKLNKYFKNKIELKKWISEQGLNSLFKNNIEKDEIVPFTNTNPFVNYKNMTLNEIYDYVDKTVNLIKLRNNINQ